jgi:hypothetical protein
VKLFDFTETDKTSQNLGNGRMIQKFDNVSRVLNKRFNYISACKETDNINKVLIQSLETSDLQVLKHI